jgi:protein-S-isoprenylcysteine O-methyltransferase Ste14
VEGVAYWLALLAIFIVPYVLAYWFLLHPFARQWRRLGPAAASVIVHSLALLLMVVIFLLREPILRIHYGVSVSLAALGGVFFLTACYIGMRRGWHMRFHTVAGLQELSPLQPGKLVTEGIYGRMRHPRYVQGFLLMAALALVTNYLAVYILCAVYVPAILLVVLLEDRELRDRFGEAYVDYCREVPRFVPRWRKRKSIGAKHGE